MRLLIALSLILLATSPAASQQPQKPQTNQEQLASPYRGTEEAPFIVKTVPEKKSPEDAVAQEEKTKLDREMVKLTGQLANYTLLLFLATGALSVGTIGIVVVAYCQMREARKSINAAQRAASTAERALIELERPFVYARIPNSGFKVERVPYSQSDGLTRGRLEMRFPNYGRTPATLTRIAFDIDIVPHGRIIDPIDPSKIGGRELPIGIISAPNDFYSEFEDVRRHFIGDDEEHIVSSKQMIWIVGFIRYKDIFDTNYITGFCLVLDLYSSGFVMRGDMT